MKTPIEVQAVNDFFSGKTVAVNLPGNGLKGAIADLTNHNFPSFDSKDYTPYDVHKTCFTQRVIAKARGFAKDRAIISGTLKPLTAIGYAYKVAVFECEGEL